MGLEVRYYEVRKGVARVVILKDGACVADLEWEVAAELGMHLVVNARKAEEWEKAVEIASDAAVLIRSGAPFGMTDDPRIQAEAKHIAETNRDLRRYMPSIRSTELFGTPTIRQTKKRIH